MLYDSTCCMLQSRGGNGEYDGEEDAASEGRRIKAETCLVAAQFHAVQSNEGNIV